VLYAWDPIARKERWRAAGGGAGPFSGGSLATAGNLVFSSVNNRLLAFRADDGEKVFDMDLGTSQMGPPISFTMNGKQYIAVTGGPGAGSRGATPPKPAQLLVLALNGNAPLPW
jgi:quinohemoprotein ethanol dehydrogenase